MLAVPLWTSPEQRERGEGGKRRGDGGRCCHGNRIGARLTSKPGQRGERERSHGSCPPGWEGRVRASSHPILYRPAGAVTQIVEDMRLCYFSGFQGRVYANNVFAFIVVVVLGFLFVFLFSTLFTSYFEDKKLFCRYCVGLIDNPAEET